MPQFYQNYKIQLLSFHLISIFYILKHVIHLFNITVLKSITDSDSEEDENSKSLIGYGTFLGSQENKTLDETIIYNTSEQPEQPIDFSSDSLTDFDKSKGKKI